MSAATTQQLEQQTIGQRDVFNGKDKDHTFIDHNHNNNDLQMKKLKNNYTKWVRIITYILFVLVGQTIGILLGRLYFFKGGNSKWLATLLFTAGFPILIPFKFFFHSSSQISTSRSPSLSPNPGSFCLKLVGLYIAFGLLLAGVNLMYSFGLQYLPVSTYSLLCATLLAFNAITSFFINSQKFTILVINSVVILTISACLLAINPNNEGSNTTNEISKGKFVLGVLITIGASATYSLYMSLTQFSFEKIIKDQSFDTVLRMQLYPSFVASCVCVVGLFGSGDWTTLKGEMSNFKMGSVSYVIVLVSSTISWQLTYIGILGLIFEVSSLFSNVIITMTLPVVPIFGVIFFHDKMNGVKIISLVLALWGFVSYMYQNYLDNIEDYKAKKNYEKDIGLVRSTEMC
ncbi:unnamed protein product [Amaranthus hypochondriacus]